MNLDTLQRRYERLRRELADAYAQQPWQSSRIDRIANELAEAEMTLAAANHLPAGLVTPGASATPS